MHILPHLLAGMAASAATATGPSDIRDMPVLRNGSQLLLNDKPWRAVGPNIYWLGLDENVVVPEAARRSASNATGTPFYAPLNASYPTRGRVSEIMATVRAMGGTAIRAHTLGVSTGNPLSVWPTARPADGPNADALAAIDWAVYQAREYGLRLLVPLTDNYDYYHGGKFTFLRWAGFTNANGNRDSRDEALVPQFYNNATVVALFHDYVRVLLTTHVNPWTNMTYAEDPTIFAYETGNELTGPIWGDMDVPATWLQATARLIKQLAPNKLVVDGTYGINATHLTIPEVDVVSDHFYPVSVSKLRTGADAAAKAAKAYFAGEYSWTGDVPTLAAFFRAAEAHPAVAGDMLWSQFGHAVPNCSAFVDHSDGLTLQYGNPANSADVTRRVQLIRQHLMAAGQNQTVAANAELPAVSCPAAEKPDQ